MPANNLGQSLGATLGAFAFGGNTRDAEMKGMLQGAQAGAYDATRQRGLAEALKAEAETRMLRQQEDARTPDALFRSAATAIGAPLDDLPAIEQYRKTGELGGRYAPDAFGVGPVAPQPDWARNLPSMLRSLGVTQRAIGLGDKSVENAAKADAIGRESFLGDEVIAGRVDPLKLSQSQFALKGSAPFNFSEFGTGNNLTGKLDDTTGPAVRLGEKRKAETKAQQANAVQSYAAADNSRASAEQTRQQTTQGGKTGNIQIVTDANGNVTLVDKASGNARPATYADGTTVGAKAANSNPSEGERNASGYSQRMEAAEKLIAAIGKSDPKAQKPGFIEQSAGGVGMIANADRSETRQQYRQAQEDWVRSKLRKESGAAIPNDEMEREIQVYFPQIGDKPAVIAQKADARKVAAKAMREAAGRAATKPADAQPANDAAAKEARYQAWKAKQGAQ